MTNQTAKYRTQMVTVSAHIPAEVAEDLYRIANRKMRENGRWMSISRLIRSIIIEYLEAKNGK